jgi:hypothetical protein
MRNETFYATMAQVLPTLLIALAVELNLWTRELLADMDNKGGGGLFGKPLLIGALGKRVLIVITAFSIGEIATVLTLFVGTRTWLVNLAGPLVGFSTLVLLVMAVALPWQRFLAAFSMG